MSPKVAIFWQVAVFTIFGIAGMANAGPVCSQDQLVGDWRLCSAEDFISGEWIRTFGDEPMGYYSFSPNGLASVQFMKTPVIDRGGPQPNSYLAYFGRYSVDEKRCEFTVNVEGSLKPNLVGTKAVRPFAIENSGILKIGDGNTFRRSFVKRDLGCPPNTKGKIL